MVSEDVRRVTFGNFVANALAGARDRGMSVADVEKATGIPNSTFYRWRQGLWKQDPRPSQVKAFCEGLGIPFTAAQAALSWSGDGKPAETEPVVDPDVRAVARRLADPKVSPEEKAIIRGALRHLARGGK